MKTLSQLYLKLLLLWAFVLLAWGVAGFFEYTTGITPIIKLQNSAYPDGLQLVHWVLVCTTGAVFLYGFISQWKWTPVVMTSMFSNLAVLCSIETFDFMSDQWGFPQYFSELVFYFGTSVFLLFSDGSKSHFKK